MPLTPRRRQSPNPRRVRLRLPELEPRLTPTTFTVTTLSDAGPGSFRQAILDANASPGADIIDFQAGLTGTITLSSTLGTITEELSIKGPGAAKLIVDANGTGRHLEVVDATVSGMPVTVAGLTLTKGLSSSGGAIRNEYAHLTLSDVTLSGNTSTGGGGAIYSLGDGDALTTIGCAFHNNVAANGNGGAIETYSGVVLLQNSVASGNYAKFNGGAIAADGGFLQVANCVIALNTADADFTNRGGGGIHVTGFAGFELSGSTVSGNTTAGSGGGINHHFGAEITITNSTISSNRAARDGGGLRSADGFSSRVIANSTVAFNSAEGQGGGIDFIFNITGSLTLASAIVAGNTAKTGSDLSGNASANFSLIGNAAGATLTGSNNLTNLNPRLGLLANNGGPTPTHLPGTPSPARDAGFNPFALTSDQRGAGFPRLIGSAVDIGAVESAAGIPVAFPVSFLPVTTAGGTAVNFSVTYADDVAIDAAKLGTGDIRVTGPGGFDVLAAFTGSGPGSLPGETVANYTFIPPGGSWDAGDNGNYAVTLEPNQVADDVGNFVAAGSVGGLTVDIQAGTPAAKVSAVEINGGAAQRSRVTTLKVTFDQSVALPPNPADAFLLKRQGDNAIVTLNAVPTGNAATLTFAAGPLDFGSLADGRYTLTVLAAEIPNLDGDGDGTAGDDYVLVGAPGVGPNLFRLFGDADGSGSVDALDFGAFRQAFGSASNLAFDFDGSGSVDALDFGQFRQRFGTAV